ncbi:MAG: trigger factor [Acidimicrobiia bacterium]
METTVEQLEGNTVKLHIAISEAELEPAIDAAFRKLAREVRIPGFRPGKAPRRILEARFGTEVGREQALKDGLPEFYADAVVAEDIDVIAPPKIDITAGEESGPVEFDAVVETRPVVQLSGYEGLRVQLDYEPVDDDAVNRQIDALRGRFADLEDSDDPLVDSSYASIDLSATVDGEPVDALSATDLLYEVGSEGLVPALDEQLRGSGPGAVLEFTDALPERFGDRAGTEVSFRVLVKEAKRKVLPELTDEWVVENTDADSVEALREESRRRIDLFGRLQAQMALRDRALEELAGLVDVEVPESLVGQEMESRLHDLVHRLEHQGATIPQWLAATGQDQSEFLDQTRAAATRAVLADLALRAVVTQEAIEASDEDLDAEIARIAERAKEKPQNVRRDLDRRGLLEAVRSDIARGKALQYVVDAAVALDSNGNEIDVSIPEPEVGDDGETNASDDPSVADTTPEEESEA